VIEIACVTERWARLALESSSPPWDLAAAVTMVVSSDFARRNGADDSTTPTAPNQSSNVSSGHAHGGSQESDNRGGPSGHLETGDNNGHDRSASRVDPPVSPSLYGALSAIDRAIAASLGSGLTAAEEGLRVCGLVEATGLPPAAAREALQMNEWSITRAANHYIPKVLYISPEQQRRQAAAAAAEARARIAAEEKKAADDLKRATEVQAAEEVARVEEARLARVREAATSQEELAQARLAAEAEKRQWTLEEAAAEELAATENAALESAATQAIAAVKYAQEIKRSSESQQLLIGAQERDIADVTSEVNAAEAAALVMERRQREIEARRMKQEADAAAAALKEEEDEEHRVLQVQNSARLRIGNWIKRRWVERQVAKSEAEAAARAADAKTAAAAAEEARRAKTEMEEAAAAAAVEAARVKAQEEAAAAAVEAARVRAEEEAAAAAKAACTVQRFVRRRHACSLVAQRRLSSQSVGAAARGALARRRYAALRWAAEQARADENSDPFSEETVAEAAAEAKGGGEEEREPVSDASPVACGATLHSSSEGSDAHMTASAVEEASDVALSGGTSPTEEEQRLREESIIAMEAERKRNHSLARDATPIILREPLPYHTSTSTEPFAPAPPRSMPPTESAEEARSLLEAAAAHRARADAQAAARKQQQQLMEQKTSGDASSSSRSSSSKWARTQALAKAEVERAQHSGFGAAGERKKPAVARKVVNGVEYERVGGGWAPLYASSALWQPRDALRMEKRRQQEEEEAQKLVGRHQHQQQSLPPPLSQPQIQSKRRTNGPPRSLGRVGSVSTSSSGSQSVHRHRDAQPNRSVEGASTAHTRRSATPPANAKHLAAAATATAAADQGRGASDTQRFLPPLGLPLGRVPIKVKTR